MYRKKVGSDRSHTKGFVFLSLFYECEYLYVCTSYVWLVPLEVSRGY